MSSLFPFDCTAVEEQGATGGVNRVGVPVGEGLMKGMSMSPGLKFSPERNGSTAAKARLYRCTHGAILGRLSPILPQRGPIPKLLVKKREWLWC